MIASQARRVELGDGAVTHVEQWGHGGPVVLCVHGITSSRRMWARSAELLASDFRVVAYDQRGHGDSADVPGPMTLERSLADLAAVAESVGDPVYGLIGHSWGGALAVLGGRRIPVERVIAVDPMVHQAPDRWAPDFVDDLREVFAVEPGRREPAIRAMFAHAPPIEIDAKVHAMGSMRLETIVALGAENAADQGKWDLREALRAYPVPLYLPLADPSDSVVLPADLEFIRRYGGPKIQIEIYTGEGHTLQRSAFDRFAAATRKFLTD